MSHTEGRLMILSPLTNGLSKFIGPGENSAPIAAVDTEADARRLVATWNACDGLPQDSLDGGWSAAGISKYAKGLEDERDELLAALERLERVSGQAMPQDDRDRAVARAILAKYPKVES